MKYKTQTLEDKIVFFCIGKFKQPSDFLTFKKTLLLALELAPTLKALQIHFDSFPIDLNILGLLLKLSDFNSYTITLQTTNYSNFRMLEDLYLLKKLNIEYLKESQ